MALDKLKIAIVVHGRFDAFDLARELLRQGHDLTLFTNYPKSIAEKFGVPKRRVRNWLWHGAVSRLIGFCHRRLRLPALEPFLHRSFAKWAAFRLRGEDWDVTYAFSGVAEEIFLDAAIKSRLKLLVRGSAHIRAQHDLLVEEGRRAGMPIEGPSRWMIGREEREYELADRIVVLSTFAKKSFIRKGVREDKLALLPLGTDTRRFRPDERVIKARRSRILSGERLRVLTVGSLSFQKGAADLIETASALGDAFQFEFVGSVLPEARSFLKNKDIEFIPKQPQFKLPEFYEWADVFIFPTIQDGYAVVLAQAQAAGLPILTTENCCGPDIIEEGRTGWVLPIRSPGAFMERLSWCDGHRAELARMVEDSYYGFMPRDWSQVASDLVDLCKDAIERKRGAE